jgi:hypothetical protein
MADELERAEAAEAALRRVRSEVAAELAGRAGAPPPQRAQ